MFFDIGVKDIIDVLLVAFLLYYTYKLMKASGSINVFTGILIFILIWLVVSQVLEMKLLGSIFDKLVSVGVVALIILFQDEIRRFLLTLGSHQHASALVRFFTGNKKENMQHDEIMPVVMACISMGKQPDKGLTPYLAYSAIMACCFFIWSSGALYCLVASSNFGFSTRILAELI